MTRRPNKTGNWEVQIGKGKQSYRVKYWTDNYHQALRWYQGLNVHSGYKKRLISPSGDIVAVQLTQVGSE
jgi:hypothetical protein